MNKDILNILTIILKYRRSYSKYEPHFYSNSRYNYFSGINTCFVTDAEFEIYDTFYCNLLTLYCKYEKIFTID